MKRHAYRPTPFQHLAALLGLVAYALLAVLVVWAFLALLAAAA